MRILMIHNRYGTTARGGAERVVERLVDALRERGHDVGVHHRTTIGFDVLNRIPVPFRAVWHLADLLNVTAALRLHATLRRTKPDIIHTHNLVGCGGLMPWVIRRSRIPWVHTLHDVQLITPSGLLTTISPPLSEGEREGVARRVHAGSVGEQGDFVPSTRIERSFLGNWLRAIRRSLLKSPHVVTSPSRWLLQLHRAHRFFPHASNVVIVNPIDVPVHPLPTRSGAVRRFLFLGQVEGVKGILVLIEAHRQLHALYDDVHLHVVGDGALLPTLKRMSRDVRGLVLRGRLDADGVRAALAEADLLVVPSLCVENQPSAILEAYAAGVPVIASRVGGIPEIVRDGETGFLVDPGSVEDFLRALRAAVEDPKRMRAMAPACHAVALEYATHCVVDQFLEIYEQVTASRYG